MLASKNANVAAAVQQRLNAVFDLLIELPPYRNIGIDISLAYHMLQMLAEQADKWHEATTPGSDGYQRMQTFLSTFEGLANNLVTFLNQIDIMLESYFDRLKRRSKGAYGFAFAKYYMDMLKNAPVFAPDINWGISTDVGIEFVPVNTLTDDHKPVIAERMQFSNLVSFLYADFYRGLIHGNCPRRCQNCGKYFLLTAGYNTCYCNNIAPGETSRTCRKVGAHRKAEREKASDTPAQQEYRRAYDRLKMRKSRYKISVDEWNTKVALAQAWRDLAEQGQLSDSELREKLESL